MGLSADRHGVGTTSETTKNQQRSNVSVPSGPALLRDPLLNKGTAFTEAERAALGLNGLLPPHVFTLEEQVKRVLENYRNKSTDLERYIHLVSLQDRNETLFYRVLAENLEEMMPIIYTPTVGLACQQFGHIFRRARGMYLSIKHRGQIAKVLENWPQRDVRAVVMTDGERTLGLGDQGLGGMGIPIGKLSIYTACGGIDPAKCLPVLLDVGTENEDLLRDPLYMGIRQRRLRGKEYDDFVGEFIQAAKARWPTAVLQFEDFGNTTAFRLLERWRNEACTFNDDIQGTASVTLAGLLSALRLTETPLRDQRILFLGAGEAGVGVADLIVSAMVDDGLKLEEARQKCWLVDSKGVVVKGRSQLAEHKLRYAHESKATPDLISAIRMLKPTAIIGVSTIPKSFDREVIETMSAINQRPIVFALSNPTSKSECSAEEAYTWSRGKAVFASGSPFPTCNYQGKTFVPGQCNNSYIFPGVALGVIACEAKHVTDRMFSEAAKALVACVADSDLAVGRLFPPLARIREISAHIAAAVAQETFRDGSARIEQPRDLLELVKSKMWEPQYCSYID
jgi:malate dehydrogenase (oxaloacetate-decarboxylating)(NADP+)